jgi:hypothetical protein
MEHVCIACKRRRSTSYHKRHPLTPGRHPKPGVCSRCIQRLSLYGPDKSSSIVVKEVHHYHHYEVHHQHYPMNEVEQATSPQDLPAFCSELPAETHYRRQAWTNDDPPPPVYHGTKPTISRESGWREDTARDIMYRQRAVHRDADSIELHSLVVY